MNRKIITSIIILIVLLAGAGFWFFKRSFPSGAPGGPVGKNAPKTVSGKAGLDADGFMWGTEANPFMSFNLEIGPVNDLLKTDHIKIRMARKSIPKDGNTFGPYNCFPSADNCRQKTSLDDVISVFQKNNWKMLPMFTLDQSGGQVTESTINDYVDWVDWFVSRYHDKIVFPYIELVNNPAQDWGGPNNLSNWPGTAAQLLELNNKVYDRIKSKFPEIKVTTPGFEYWSDATGSEAGLDPGKVKFSQKSLEYANYFLDKKNGAKFDIWAFHGYQTNYPAGPDVLDFYPPTKTAAQNKYAGIPGMIEIRKKLDENGWQDREMIDTEQWAIQPFMANRIPQEYDRMLAAYIGQEIILKKTLAYGNKPVLIGANMLLVQPKGSMGMSQWGSLNPDGTPTLHFLTAALLWSKFDQYHYDSHLSGQFDDQNQPWVEKFKADNGNEMYMFFKPFEFVSGQQLKSDGQKSNYSVKLDRMPKSVTLTDIDNKKTELAPSQNIELLAENAPKMIEIRF